MHQGILAARDQMARVHIADTLLQIAQLLGVPFDPVALTGIQGRDPRERSMRFVEGVSVVLDQVLAALSRPVEAPAVTPRRKRVGGTDGVSD